MEEINRSTIYISLGLIIIAAVLVLTLLPQETKRDAKPTDYGHIDISAVKAKQLIDENPNLVIIDVSPDYADAHIPGAVHYYIGDGSLDEAIPNLDKNATYLVYCHFNSASVSGARKLVNAGFQNVYRLEGNFQAWINAGYEIEKE